MTRRPSTPGALVVSLDFELHWGIRDHSPADSGYRPNLLGVRRAVPEILDTFRAYGIRATWATVGFLMARDRAELSELSPAIRPRYLRAQLDPYAEPLGEGESDDPLHFAASLVELIRDAPGQEVGSHTFSHYYCDEPGQDVDTFRADLESAVRMASRRGISLRSMVFPRNQVNRDYLRVLADLGFVSYRGNLPHPLHTGQTAHQALTVRALRLADAYVPLSGRGVVGWDGLTGPHGLCNVPATRFLRPYDPRLRPADPLRVRRIVSSLNAAARSGGVVHLWWHPHNFGVYLEENLAVLRTVLDRFATLRETDGMVSLAMHDVAPAARGEAPVGAA